ncbi:MAG TPA: response regulator [Dyella sp.]|uniref:response regulator n=1 Tax=Dyella sp. TaxID=1869338 RepID=UPI002B80D776|nr:response regulator [Dyella sp.]HUB91819.1 response regulator [Dyella sp.]
MSARKAMAGRWVGLLAFMCSWTLAAADDGAPTARSALRDYAWEIASFTLGVALLAFFAWRAWGARKNAAHSEKLKSRLLSVMSHEIRPSIHALLGSIDTLRRTPLSEHQQHLAHTATNAAQALLQRVDELLDLSKLDAHRMPLGCLHTDGVDAPLAAAEAPMASTTDGVLMGTQPRILVVEDHPQSRFILLEQLKTQGVEPVGLSDGAAALAEVARQRPALILMDCHMPDMDGYETTRRIRQREAEQGLPPVPIIAISSASDARHLTMCVDSGMDGVLKKPLRPEELRAILQVWLEQAPHQADEAAVARDESPNIGLRALYQASMAEDILAIEQAIKRRQGEEIAHFAHRMKGAALMLGAREMADAADRLEQVARNATAIRAVQMETMVQALKQAIARYFEPIDSAR